MIRERDVMGRANHKEVAMKDRDRGRYYPTHCKPYRTPMTRGERIARWLIAGLVDMFGLFLLWGGVEEAWFVFVVLIIMFIFPYGAYRDIKYSYDVGEAERVRMERGLP
ncbi:MAG TPA: hypothetical protein PKL35_05255 [Methanoregulaceae archaeon]|jgi:hypothetical protein|nr:hypothetical protein [Methanoregulaceae archaeon]